MKNYCFICLSLLIVASCSGTKDGTGFDEPSDPNTVPLAYWAEVDQGMHAAVGSIDERYEYHYPPSSGGNDSWSGSAWRGERINIQLKLWSSDPVQDIRVGITSLRSVKGDQISDEQIGIHPVRYVLTDEFLTGCGWRDHDTIPAYLASDMLDNNQRFNLEKNTLRPVWITIDVPSDAEAGEYSGSLIVSFRGGRDIELPVDIKVIDVNLPEPSDWSFHLDLWQNPFAVARYYDTGLWTEEHWALLPPYLEMLAGAGQKCITASILHRPWGGQTYDHFESMIEWTHLGDGDWEYDYSVFDRWVQLAMDAGITEQINCYSMVPWGNEVRYYDRDYSDYVTVTLKPGSDEYNRVWRPFLESFRDHLTEKGWLEKTLIAMDERGPDEMSSMVALLREVTPEFRIALAGGYIEELNDDIYDLCVFFGDNLDKELIRERVVQGWPTTFYTMCARPEHPNNFTFSPPAEQAWLGWHAASRGFTGFLRWAYNSWVEDPVSDSRFRTWPAGDTYQVYPGPRSSIRFERLREGIQDYEKIRILREFAEKTGKEERLANLDGLLEHFTMQEIQETAAGYWLNKAKIELEDLSLWMEREQ